MIWLGLRRTIGRHQANIKTGNGELALVVDGVARHNEAKVQMVSDGSCIVVSNQGVGGHTRKVGAMVKVYDNRVGVIMAYHKKYDGLANGYPR